MFVKKGLYSHSLGEASITFSAQSLRSRWRGFRYAILYRMEIQGELSCNHPTKSLDEQIEDFLVAYSKDNETIGLYHDNGTATRHILLRETAELRDGPHIEVRQWPKGDIGEYAAQRTYHIVATAEYNAPDVNDATPRLIKYQEAMRYVGQPAVRWRTIYDQDGAEQTQVLQQAFPLRLIQSGHSIGYGQRFYPLGPIEPTRVLPDLTIVELLAPTFGSALTFNQGGVPMIDWAKEYETTWQYVMEIPFLPALYMSYLPVSR